MNYLLHLSTKLYGLLLLQDQLLQLIDHVREFLNMPGVWFIDKNKANCIKSWRNIDYVYAKRNEMSELLDKRQRYLYNWNQRIIAMQKIK